MGVVRRLYWQPLYLWIWPLRLPDLLRIRFQSVWQLCRACLQVNGDQQALFLSDVDQLVWTPSLLAANSLREAGRQQVKVPAFARFMRPELGGHFHITLGSSYERTLAGL